MSITQVFDGWLAVLSLLLMYFPNLYANPMNNAANRVALTYAKVLDTDSMFAFSYKFEMMRG